MAAVTSIPRTTLRRIPLGSAKDVFVTDVCLGTMTWGVQNTEAEAHEQLDYAIKQRGVNFIDTAEMYPVPMSRSELDAGNDGEVYRDLVGEELERRARRCRAGDEDCWVRRKRENRRQ